MAAETETISVLDIRVEGAVKNVKDLKDNIRELKKQLNEFEGDLNDPQAMEEYQDKLEQLKLNQNALKDAMHATTGSFQDVIEGAKGTTETYNSLVHTMADLKAELRNTDVSTKEGVKRFNDLAKQIDNVNTKLKNMDAAQGNYQRNVGNYSSALTGLADNFKSVAGGAASVVNPVKNVTAGFKTLSATPVIGILGLLANVLVQVTGALKSSEDNANRVTQAFSIFGGVGDAITKLMQGLGKAVAWVAEKFSAVYEAVFGLSEAMEQRKEITEQTIALAQREREATMQNADAQREIAELQAKVNDRISYTLQERLGFLERANQLEEEISKREYENLKTQYNIIKAKNALTESSTEDLKKEADAYAAMVNAETAYYNAIRSNNAKISTLRKEAASESKKSVQAMQEEVKENALSLESILKDIEAVEKALDEERKTRLAEQAELDAMTLQQTADLTAEIDAYFDQIHQEELQRMEEERIKAEETAQAKIDSLHAVANATYSIMGSIADLYEADTLNSAKNAAKVKALRIAQATIDTITGAVGALTSAAANPGGIPGMIIGTANAAAITTAGVAQIAKIRSTNIPGASAGSSSASISAPSVGTEIPRTRNVTSASEEVRLNQMASDQRVVLVMSDLEAKQGQIKVQTEESSF